jgi:DNA modification methylase
VHHVKVLLVELFGGDHFLNEIIWSYRSGGRSGRWFPRKHDTLLLYAKRLGHHTFNRLRDGAYRTRDLRVTNGGRPYKSTRAGPIYFDPAGPVIPDVWDIPFLSTVATERTDYPSQKPEALLERVVKASSNEGDLVADFFCGSGTTLAVAKRLNRRYLGCDINPDAVEITKRRLAQTSKAVKT